jgi:hypothetical protein
MADDMDESWKKLVAKWGVSAAIAMYLVYTMTTTQQQLLKETRDDAAAARAAITAHNESMAPLLWNMQALVNISLQDCINRADDVVKREKCFRAQYEKPSR